MLGLSVPWACFWLQLSLKFQGLEPSGLVLGGFRDFPQRLHVPIYSIYLDPVYLCRNPFQA